MAVNQFQLVNVRIRGSQDNQAAGIPSIWLYSTLVDSRPLSDFSGFARHWWRNHILPKLSSGYNCYAYEAWLLGGLSMQYTNDVPPKFRSVRENWTQRHVIATDENGASGSNAEPSFVAFSCKKVVGTAGIIVNGTGVFSSTPPAIGPRAGGFRIPGVDESHTVAGGNALEAGQYTTLNTGIQFLVNSGWALGDTFGAIKLAMVSKESQGGSRLNKDASPTDPLLWTPRWVAAEITSLVLNPYVGSQVSRKRQYGKFQ